MQIHEQTRLFLPYLLSASEQKKKGFFPLPDLLKTHHPWELFMEFHRNGCHERMSTITGWADGDWGCILGQGG